MPQVIQQFVHMKQQLPITTRTLIAGERFFLQAYGSTLPAVPAQSWALRRGEENHEPLSLAQLAGEWLADQKAGLCHQQRPLYPHAQHPAGQ